MALHRVKHPLIDDALSELRDASTPPEHFRPLASRVTTLLAYDASRDLPRRTERVRTPLEETDVHKLDASVVLVPVLRAGMGMLDVMLSVFPSASVGYVGLERDESTAVARQYYRKFPDLSDRFVFLLDPMLATGGSASAAVSLLKEHAAMNVRLLCIVAAPEGIETGCPRTAPMSTSTPRPSTAASTSTNTSSRAWVTSETGSTGRFLSSERLY